MPSARLACLFVPLFPLAARLRSEPDLKGEAVAVFEGNGNAARVVAAARKAREKGIQPGMTLPQARSIFPKLIARARDLESERAAQEALLEIAEIFSPRVEDVGEGLAYLDIDGIPALTRAPAALGEGLCRLVASRRATAAGAEMRRGETPRTPPSRLRSPVGDGRPRGPPLRHGKHDGNERPENRQRAPSRPRHHLRRRKSLFTAARRHRELQARRARRRGTPRLAHRRARRGRATVPEPTSSLAPRAPDRHRGNTRALGHPVDRRVRAPAGRRGREPPGRARPRASHSRARNRSAPARAAPASSLPLRRDGSGVAARLSRALPLPGQRGSGEARRTPGVPGPRLREARGHFEARSRRLRRARDRAARAHARGQDSLDAHAPGARGPPARGSRLRFHLHRASGQAAPRPALPLRPRGPFPRPPGDHDRAPGRSPRRRPRRPASPRQRPPPRTLHGSLLRAPAPSDPRPPSPRRPRPPLRPSPPPPRRAGSPRRTRFLRSSSPSPRGRGTVSRGAKCRHRNSLSRRERARGEGHG